MIRTQIQLPEPLYREVKRVAREQEWSVAEVLRRGAESVTRSYPAASRVRGKDWKLPPPLETKLIVLDPEGLRDAIRADEEIR